MPCPSLDERQGSTNANTPDGEMRVGPKVFDVGVEDEMDVAQTSDGGFEPVDEP